ncbi:hypothetical protein [Microbacterium immunditiarum]|uniref:Uncharacterized protein n=1 Tax=Microbacterium immunditiarum TaxID=337480 RepID=A0A7Y9KK93_9MICO|nr:hypothetical protein [Microbacterium immunditiarum]NYE20575.1 hypothetical protein [Microbacterium immunditiarum]
MPGRWSGSLATAERWYQRAVVTHQDGAFSPFWSAIESAYASLGLYNQSILALSNVAQQRSVVEELISLDALTADVAHFPVELDTVVVEQRQGDIVAKLDALVYEAQRQPTFATIGEQRQTTSAVVAGFRNLEAAVDRMRWSLAASLG